MAAGSLRRHCAFFSTDQRGARHRGKRIEIGHVAAAQI